MSVLLLLMAVLAALVTLCFYLLNLRCLRFCCNSLLYACNRGWRPLCLHAHWGSKHWWLSHSWHHPRPHTWRSRWPKTHSANWSSWRISLNWSLTLIIASCLLITLSSVVCLSLNIVISNDSLRVYYSSPQIFSALFKSRSLFTLALYLTFSLIYTDLLLSLYYLDLGSLHSSNIGKLELRGDWQNKWLFMAFKDIIFYVFDDCGNWELFSLNVWVRLKWLIENLPNSIPSRVSSSWILSVLALLSGLVHWPVLRGLRS